MRVELSVELAAFYVGCTPSGNVALDVRARDHQRRFVLATVFAL